MTKLGRFKSLLYWPVSDAFFVENTLAYSVPILEPYNLLFEHFCFKYYLCVISNWIHLVVSVTILTLLQCFKEVLKTWVNFTWTAAVKSSIVVVLKWSNKLQKQTWIEPGILSRTYFSNYGECLWYYQPKLPLHSGNAVEVRFVKKALAVATLIIDEGIIGFASAVAVVAVVVAAVVVVVAVVVAAVVVMHLQLLLLLSSIRMINRLQKQMVHLAQKIMPKFLKYF